ncbi:hypothetical protein YC2023_027904 [Brassica napus]
MSLSWKTPINLFKVKQNQHSGSYIKYFQHVENIQQQIIHLIFLGFQQIHCRYSIVESKIQQTHCIWYNSDICIQWKFEAHTKCDLKKEFIMLDVNGFIIEHESLVKTLFFLLPLIAIYKRIKHVNSFTPIQTRLHEIYFILTCIADISNIYGAVNKAFLPTPISLYILHIRLNNFCLTSFKTSAIARINVSKTALDAREYKEDRLKQSD